MQSVIGWASIVASAILFAAGMYELVTSWRTNAQVRAAADKAATVSERVNENTATLAEQAGIDFKGQWEALAALATALKDLDRSARLLLLSLAFLAIGAASIGLTDLASAIASTR